MKRKFSEIDNELKIILPTFLLCDICSKKIYNYQLCTNPYTYCSVDCLEILVLSQKNDYLDTHNMKKVKIFEDLMELNTSERASSTSELTRS